MVNKERYIGLGIDQDTAPDKRKSDTYWDAENIRIINNGRNLSIKPINGSVEYIADMPFASSDFSIVGTTEINGELYIFVTDSNSEPSSGSNNLLVKIDSTGTSTIILSGISADQMQLTSKYPLEIVANYENENIIKLYWTDGVTMLKSINVKDPSPKVNIVQEIDISQPLVSLQTGGSLLAGNIQYAYSLYNLNGQESALSPLSQIISVTENMKGFESNEVTGLSCEVIITADTEFEYIRLYSIHYLELNQTPKINLIAEEAITNSSFIFVDDGNSFVSTLTDLELQSIGGRPFVVGTLAAKRNRLFIANYKTNNFDPDIDVRAFSHSTASSYTEYRLVGDGAVRTNLTTELPGLTNDCINYDYSVYKFIRGGTAYGATGVNMQISLQEILLSSAIGSLNQTSLKRGEIYRFGVVFYNILGQQSPAKWICDLKIPYGDRTKVIVPATKLMDTLPFQNLGIIKYQLVMVERKPYDRTIISQGFLVPILRYIEKTSGDPAFPNYYPYYAAKDIHDGSLRTGLKMSESYDENVDWGDVTSGTEPPARIVPEKSAYDVLMAFYSSDTIFEDSVFSGDTVVCVGTNKQNADTDNYTQLLEIRSGIITNSYAINSLRLDGYNSAPLSLGINPSNFMASVSTGVNETFAITFQRNYPSAESSPVINTTDEDVSLPFNSDFVKTGETKTMFGGSSVFSNYAQLPGLIVYEQLPGLIVTTNYIAKFPGCCILQFNVPFFSAAWNELTSVSWDRFISGGADEYRRLPIVDLKRTLANQYGGNTYEAKQRNEYIKGGEVSIVSSLKTTPHLTIGDIYVGPLSINRSDSENYLGAEYWNVYEHLRLDYIENNHNVYARNDNMFSWSSGLTVDTNYRFFRIADNHRLLGAYNQKPTLFKAFSKPVNFSDVTYFANVVQASEEKFPNELVDSWLKFPVNENRYLEGVYGKINKLYNFKGEIFVFQDKAIAMLAINPRIQTQATDGVNIELGIGAVLYDHRYLSTTAGCIDKFTVIDDDKMLYYYDRNTHTINVLENDKLSTMLGIRSILENVNSITSGVYHRNLDEILFDVPASPGLPIPYSIVYNTILKKFTHRLLNESGYYRYRKHFIFGNKLLYHDETDGGSIREKYKDTFVLPSSITYLMCPASIYEKVFHNLEYRLKGTDFTEILVTDEDGNTSGTVVPDIQNKFNIKRIHLPRKQDSRERWRGIYIFVKLENDSYFSLDDLVVMYNIKG